MASIESPNASRTDLALIRTEYAKLRTRLANQRTYLAYMRTGFVIAAIGGALTKGRTRTIIFIFGLLMSILSAIQYGVIINNVHHGAETNMWVDYTLFGFVILSLGVLGVHYQNFSEPEELSQIDA